MGDLPRLTPAAQGNRSAERRVVIGNRPVTSPPLTPPPPTDTPPPSDPADNRPQFDAAREAQLPAASRDNLAELPESLIIPEELQGLDLEAEMPEFMQFLARPSLPEHGPESSSSSSLPPGSASGDLDSIPAFPGVLSQILPAPLQQDLLPPDPVLPALQEAPAPAPRMLLGQHRVPQPVPIPEPPKLPSPPVLAAVSDSDPNMSLNAQISLYDPESIDLNALVAFDEKRQGEVLKLAGEAYLNAQYDDVHENLAQKTLPDYSQQPQLEEFHCRSFLPAPLPKEAQQDAFDQLMGTSFDKIKKDLPGKIMGHLRHVSEKDLGRATNEAERLMLNSKEGGLAAFVAAAPREELRAQVSQSLGLGHIGQLSPAKTALLDAVCTGLAQGAQKFVKAEAKDKAQGLLQNADPRSDQVFGLSLKSQQDLLAEVAEGLNLVDGQTLEACKKDAQEHFTPELALKWLKDLPPEQADLVKSLATSLTETLEKTSPNRASQTMIPVKNRSGMAFEVPEELQLNNKVYDSPKFLGQGGLGLILEYTNQADPSDVVVIKSLLDPSQRDDMVTEMKAHRHMMGGGQGQGHPNVIDLKGIVKGPADGLYMVMEKATGGDLSQLAKSINVAAETGVMPLRAQQILTQHYLRQAATGLQAVHDQGGMHNDMKGLNYLVHEGQVKISDFGSATTTGELTDLATANTYKSPEWLAEEPQLNQKSDIYQLGLMFHMLNGGALDLDAMGRAVLEVKTEPGGALGALRNAMVNPNPALRPNIEGVLDSEYLQDLDTHPPDQVMRLAQAAEAFNQVVGRDIAKCQDQIYAQMGVIDRVEGNIKREEGLKQGYLDRYKDQHPPSYAQDIADYDANIQKYQKQIGESQTEIARLEAEIKVVSSSEAARPLAEALKQAAQGFA